MIEQQTIPTNHRQTKRKLYRKKLILVAIAVIFIAAGIWVSYLALRNTSTTAHIDTNKYQAVFFTNGQVYFGKLEALSGGYMKLEDVFYLQTKTDTASDNPQETAVSTDSNNVELIKLGNEIHGPEDEMVISRDQVLFFENLKEDGRVTQSIKSYKTQKSS